MILLVQEEPEEIPAEMIQEKTGRKLEIQSLPDLNLLLWKKWGFHVERYLKVARKHIFFQPVIPEIYEIEGENAGIILKGKIYELDNLIERKMERLIWPAYIAGLIAFAFMLKLISMGYNLAGTAFFILAYIIFDGFPIFSLRLLAEQKSRNSVRIRWDTLTRIVTIASSGIIMLSWKEPGMVEKATALAFRSTIAEKLLERIHDKIPAEAGFKILKSGSIVSPPSQPDARQ